MAAQETSSGGSSTRKASANGLNAALFFSVTIAGCAYIGLAKLYGVSALWVTFGPVLVMLSYAALVGFARLLRLRDDQSGDNLYYMGFLFTLTSLGVSLYQFNADGAAELIVQNFGVAIASTIAGIALRVLFNQLRRDPLEVEAAARMELADAARRVRRELDNTVLELAHFKRTAQQSVLDGFEETKVKVDEIAQKILQNLQEVAERSSEPLQAVSRQSGETLDSMSSAIAASLRESASHLTTETDRLSKGAATVAGTLDQISTKLAAMQTPDQVIEVKLNPMISGLTKAVNAFNKNVDAQGAGMMQAIETARASSESAIMLVDSLEKNLDRREERAHAEKSTVDGAVSALSATAAGVEAAAARSEDAIRSLADRVESMFEMVSEALRSKREAPSNPEA